MLTQIDVHSSHTPPTGFALANSNTDPIQVRGITGLGPVKASVNTTPFGSIDGEAYKGSSVGKRNIVFTFGLNPNWVDQSIASLRQLLYEYFMPKQSVKLTFHSDLPTCAIYGIVESFEPNIFSRDPEIQVSIICPMPDFVSVASSQVNGIVGDGSTSIVIDYEGTISTGFVLEVRSTVGNVAYTGNIEVQNQVDLLQSPFVNTMDLTAIDVTVDTTKYFKMSSVRGDKYVYSITTFDSIITDILKTISPDTKWPVLEPGSNEFQVVAAESGQSWQLTYFKRFGGL